LSDEKKGNGDGVLQPGESAELVFVVKNVGKGVALNTYATLKNYSGKDLFMVKGREHLKKIEPNSWKRGLFAFDLKPTFTEKEAHLEFGLADVDLRVYSVEKLVLPVIKGTSSEPHPQIVFADGGALPEELDINSPPKLDIEHLDQVVRLSAITIRGKATDEKRVRNVYIFVGDDKVYFKPNTDTEKPGELSFEAELPLKNGINYITIFAEETAALDTRKIIVIRRDAPSGMPYFHAQSLNGEPELVQVVPE
jgi:carboxyl-terminal processing protease